MGSNQNTVYYCSLSKANQILYAYYSSHDHEMEYMASLNLERIPYFQTIDKITLIRHVYFTIADEGLRNPGVLLFLERLRDEFKKIAKKTKNCSKGSLWGLNYVYLHEEHPVPVVGRLISSSNHVSQSDDDSMIHPTHENVQIEVTSSTKTPLFAKSVKQEKKKIKEDCWRSKDLGIKIDVMTPESNNHSPKMSAIPLQKGLRVEFYENRSEPTICAQKMGRRKVRVVLALMLLCAFGPIKGLVKDLPWI